PTRELSLRGPHENADATSKQPDGRLEHLRPAVRFFRTRLPGLRGRPHPSSKRTDRSDRVFAALAGADADHLVDRGDEDLPVADLSGLGGLGDRLDDVTDH